MTRLHHYVLLFFVIAFPLYVQAAKRVTFHNQPSVSIRQTNRVLVRGELKSVDPKTVVIRVGSGFTAKEVEIDVETISTLRTVDGDIQFKAADGIDSFISSLSSRSDVDITSVAVSTSNPSTADPENSAPVNGGFGTASSSSNTSQATDSPAMNPVLNGGFGPSGTQNSTSSTGSAEPSGQKVVVICDNCKKEVSVSAEYGQECPHCGILWDVGTPVVTMPNNRSNSQMANNSAPSDGGGGGGLQPVANRVQAPDGSAPPSIQNPPAPITMENLPLWMKASIFFGCIGVLYYFFFYRA